MEGGKDSYNLVRESRALPFNYRKLAYGFYPVKGGFVMTEREGKTFPLNDRQLIWLIANDYVEFPEMSVAAVEDKSKADPLIKTIAAIQATWFVAQCIGRWAPALILWWYKAVDVKVPTHIRVNRQLQVVSQFTFRSIFILIVIYESKREYTFFKSVVSCLYCGVLSLQLQCHALSLSPCVGG